LLDQVGLGGKENAMPHQLSGGEQQRVALARALAPQPNLLLLDEPFSNLDVDLRESLSHDVREIIKQSNTTALMVTHDQHEAFAISDSIGVIYNGVLEQWGSSHSIYHHPVNAFVASFVGQGVFLNGVIQTPQCVDTILGKLDYDPVSLIKKPIKLGSRVKVLIRPNVILHDNNSKLTATVLNRYFRGADFLYTLMLPNGENLLAFVPSHHDHVIGESIGIRLKMNPVVVFEHAGS
jgi:iron(III) transport system ATP-binding protein